MSLTFHNFPITLMAFDRNVRIVCVIIAGDLGCGINTQQQLLFSLAFVFVSQT